MIGIFSACPVITFKMMMDAIDTDRNGLSPGDYNTNNSNNDNTISCRDCERYRRDSGYGTDSSPPAIKSKSRQFTFNSETENSENESTNMDLHTSIIENESDSNDDVFSDKSVPFDKRHIDYDSVAADKEVEDLLCEIGELGDTYNSYDTGVNEIRPAAPVPTTRDCHEENKHRKDYPKIKFRQFCEQTNCYCRNYYFRPISSSVWTPVLPSVNQVIESDAGLRNKPLCRCRSCHFANGGITDRVRLRSEGVERGISGSLPDVVPNQSKRPVSLPDLVDLRRHTEQEMGRELRRIGDEFDSYYKDRKTSTISWNIFACSINFHMSGYLKTIRRILSPNPQKCMENR